MIIKKRQKIVEQGGNYFEKRKLFLSTLLASFACTLIGAVSSLSPSVAKAETITYGTPVVYDLWDIKGVKEFQTVSGNNENQNLGQFSANTNVAFSSIVIPANATAETKTTNNFYFNHLILAPNKTNASHFANGGYGYQFFFKDKTMAIRYDSDPTTATAETKSEIQNGASLDETELRTLLPTIDSLVQDENTEGTEKISVEDSAFFRGYEPFLFEFGCKAIYTNDVWTGNYVYIEINGTEILSYTDTTEYFDDMGTYTGRGADGRDYNQFIYKSTYDFLDITMGEAVEGVGIEEGTVYTLPIRDDAVIDLLVEDGYAVETAMLNDTDVTDKVTWTPTATTLDCTTLTAGEYTLTLTTSKNIVDNVTVYDLYDLKGVTEYQTTSENSNVQNIGQFETNNNVAFRSIISYPVENNTNHLYINYLILKDSESAHFAYGGYGYQFMFKDGAMSIRYDNTPTVNGEIEAVASLTKAQLNSLLPTIDNLDGTGKINVTNNAFYYGQEAFKFEFGCAKYLVNGEWKANYVYVKINDVEILNFIDTGANYQARETLGKYTGRGADGRGFTNYLYSTTYTDSRIAYKLLDTFAMEKGASTRESGNGLRFTMSVAESKWEELQAYVGEGNVYSEISFGMVIVPADYVASMPLTVENLFGGEAYYLMEQNADGSWKEYTGELTPIFHVAGDELTNCTFKGAIVDLEDWNITRNFVGLGYARYVEDGVEGYVLADYYDGDIENNTRSMYQVAKLAYEANNTLTALKTNYLDKVAEIAVTYYDVTTNEALASETIYGVIGQTAFAPLRSFEGYTFVSGNNGHATAITVAETGNVLSYYFSANA